MSEHARTGDSARVLMWYATVAHQITCAETRRTVQVCRRKYLARKKRRR